MANKKVKKGNGLPNKGHRGNGDPNRPSRKKKTA